MSIISPWFPSLWDALGWTMVHFLWAGALVALFARLVLWAVRRRSGQVRYAVALAGFLLLALTPAVLCAWRMADPAPVAAMTVGIERPRHAGERIVDETAAFRQPSAAKNHQEKTANAKPAQPTEALGRAASVAASSAAEAQTSWQSFRLWIGNHWQSAVGQSYGFALRMLPWLWVCGFPLACAWILLGVTGTERLRRACRPLDNEEWLSLCRRLEQQLRIRIPVRFAVCDRLAVPLLIGIVRPLVLLPASALSGYSPEEVEMIALHELAHVRRWDNLVNLLQRLVEAVLFFHPSVWWLSRRVRLEREHCCDAVVLAYTGAPQRYAEFLAHLALPGIVPQRAGRLGRRTTRGSYPPHLEPGERIDDGLAQLGFRHLCVLCRPDRRGDRLGPSQGGGRAGRNRDGWSNSAVPSGGPHINDLAAATRRARRLFRESRGQATTPGPSETPPIRGSATPPTVKKTDDRRPSGGTRMGGRPGVREKFAEVGIVDLDNTGVGDRDVLHNLVEAANGEIADEVDDHGVRHPPGGSITVATKFLVIGKIPDYSRSKPNEVEFHKKIAALKTKMVNEATENGVRVVSMEDFLRYIGYDAGRRLGRPGATTKWNLRSGAEGTVARLGPAGGRIGMMPMGGMVMAQPSDRLARGGPSIPVERDQLRFAGRNFSQWENLLMTELDPKMRAEALSALGRFGAFGYEQEASAAIAKFLSKGRLISSDQGDQKVEEAAKEALRRIGPPAVKTALELLKDKSPEVRRLATEIVSTLLRDVPEPKPSTLEALAEVTNDRDEYVRLAALRALGQTFGRKKGVYRDLLVPVVIKKLQDDSPGIRLEAAAFLGNLGPSAAGVVPALLAALKDPRNEETGVRDYYIPRTVIEALRQCGTPPGVLVPALIELLPKAQADFGTLSSITLALGSLESRAAPAVPALIEALKRSDRTEYQWAGGVTPSQQQHEAVKVIATALGQIGPTPESPTVRTVFKEKMSKLANSDMDNSTTAAMQAIQHATRRLSPVRDVVEPSGP